MFSLKNLVNLCKIPRATPQVLQCASLKSFEPPKDYGNVEYEEKPKLSIMPKVPQFGSHIRPPKMQKRLILMRGPETVHNFLLHKQYGIIALQGGRMKYPHYEYVRLCIGRKLDTKRMFSIWRIPAPWQPLTKKGIGVRMGSGKGAIDHYCTPIKAGRVIIEVGGHCEYDEVKTFLSQVAANLPFKAMAVSQEIMEQRAAQKKANEKRNLNPYTKKYVIQNNLDGCHRWLGPFDHRWFGEYL